MKTKNNKGHSMAKNYLTVSPKIAVRFRKDHGLQLDRAADIIGVSKNNLQRFENGKLCPKEDYQVIHKIASHLNLYYIDDVTQISVDVPEKPVKQKAAFDPSLI